MRLLNKPPGSKHSISHPVPLLLRKTTVLFKLDNAVLIALHVEMKVCLAVLALVMFLFLFDVVSIFLTVRRINPCKHQYEGYKL